MSNILPWQSQAWQYLVHRRNIEKMPHALLIKGISGVGKTSFAKNLASLLLCQESFGKTEVCGECSACLLLQADNHPDLAIVKSEEVGEIIKIDQIRGLISDLSNTSHQGGYQVVIIENAELLNVAAANALLKTLEEPSERTVIILISAHPLMLPATIRSRCQALPIHVPKYFVASGWLKERIPDADVGLLLALAENAPLKALDIFRNDILPKRQEFFAGLCDLQSGKISSMQMVEKSLDWGLAGLFPMLMHAVSDIIKIKLGAEEKIVNQDQSEKLINFAQKASINSLFAYKDNLYKLRGHLANKINLNPQMVIENLIINWLQMIGG